jgi:hypothetical protein
VNRNRLILMAIVCLVSAAPIVQAVDKPIEGKKIVLRDPVDLTQRRISFLSRDANIAFGSNGDSDTPSLHGASLLVFNPVSSECQCIILPASGFVIGAEGRRYVYRDTNVAFTPVKFLMITQGKLKILTRGAGLTGVTLNETSQGEIAVHYTSGTGNKLCADFGASSIRADKPGAFVALNAPAPVACPPEPAACTPCVPPIVP